MTDTLSTARQQLRAWLLARQDCPYAWGFKGGLTLMPDGTMRDAYDCSGLVTAGLMHTGGPDWRQTHGSGALFDELPRLEAEELPQPLDLAFYGQPGQISHVVYVWDDGRIFGACGGNHTCTNAIIAAKMGAKVQFKPSRDYRPDFRGYRRFPVP